MSLSTLRIVMRYLSESYHPCYRLGYTHTDRLGIKSERKCLLYTMKVLFLFLSFVIPKFVKPNKNGMSSDNLKTTKSRI